MSNRLALVFIGILGLMIGLTNSGKTAGTISVLSMLSLFGIFFLFNLEKHEEIGLVKVSILFFALLWTGVAVTTLLAQNFCY